MPIRLLDNKSVTASKIADGAVGYEAIDWSMQKVEFEAADGVSVRRAQILRFGKIIFVSLILDLETKLTASSFDMTLGRVKNTFPPATWDLSFGCENPEEVVRAVISADGEIILVTKTSSGALAAGGVSISGAYIAV